MLVDFQEGSMKRFIGAAVVLSLLIAGAIVMAQSRQAPSFRVDPAWPKIPNNWQFGQVASVSIDERDHVWLLQRPGTLEASEKDRAAPPVIEFDAAGNFVQAWGGPGQGYE
jgi:hypothetical protein